MAGERDQVGAMTKVEGLAHAVDLLRRRVQEQAEIIEKQRVEICNLGIKLSHLPLFEETTERGISVTKSLLEFAQNDIEEIQERLWPGRLAGQLAEYRAQRKAEIEGDDDRTK